MKKVCISLVLLVASLSSFAQNQLLGNWICKVVEMPNVVKTENDSVVNINPEFLKTIEAENRLFMEALLKGMLSSLVNGEMEFKQNEELVQYKPSNKKTYKGKYKYNEAKKELKVTDASGTQKFKVSFQDANTLILDKADAKMGNMFMTFHRK